MKLPVGMVLSHCLAYGPELTAAILERNLLADKKLGYKGQVIVPALLSPDDLANPKSLVPVFESTESYGLVCAFLAGNGPDPLADDFQPALDSVRPQAMHAVEIAAVGQGRPIVVGPLHTHHRAQREIFPFDNLWRWFDALYALAEELDIIFAFEALNPTEDRTPDPFSLLYTECKQRSDRFRLHWDMGHAHSWKLNASTLAVMADVVAYLEFANVGRFPLQLEKGIEFPAIVKAMRHLHDDCLVGVEPFDPSVIKAFGLEALCTTNFLGPTTLAADRAWLGNLGVMS